MKVISVDTFLIPSSLSRGLIWGSSTLYVLLHLAIRPTALCCSSKLARVKRWNKKDLMKVGRNKKNPAISKYTILSFSKEINQKNTASIVILGTYIP